MKYRGWLVPVVLLAFALASCSGTNDIASTASSAVDTSGNVYVAGYTNGSLDGATRTGTSDFFVTKYDSSGAKHTQECLCH